ncbi:MAG: glycosyltransferase family 9 protein [Gammaproteobacteria bacterium]|nr:glycosyltransferase family 9 protein [Gammaproteobacteria bacterium]
MSGLFAQPPQNLCLIRLSAVGDVVHLLPIVHTIKKFRQNTKIAWIIGQAEHSLVAGLPGVEFIVFDKAAGPAAYVGLARKLRRRRFDALLLMQYSMRAHLASLCVRAPVRIGFDRARSKDLHGWFVNHRIKACERGHVLDGLFGFTEALGIGERQLRWQRCHGDEEQAFAERRLPGAQKTLLISPCSSHPLRNWPAPRYAEVADYAARRHAMRVVLTGGNSAVERHYRDDIVRRARGDIIDLVGRTTLRQLAALIARADAVVAPDSGPAHIAACSATPVIGLYAATNPDRAAPRLSRQWCVNRYPETVRAELGAAVDDIAWGTKLERPGVMERITTEEVCAMLDRLMEGGGQAVRGARRRA